MKWGQIKRENIIKHCWTYNRSGITNTTVGHKSNLQNVLFSVKLRIFLKEYIWSLRAKKPSQNYCLQMKYCM